MEKAIYFIQNFIQENNSMLQIVLLGIMLFIFIYFIWAIINNFLNFILSIVAFMLSLIAFFIVLNYLEPIAYFLSPNPPSWAYWAIPLSVPVIIFTVIIIIKKNIEAEQSQKKKIENERKKSLGKKIKNSKHKPPSFFKQLFITLSFNLLFISSFSSYLFITNKTAFLTQILPEKVSQLLQINNLESNSEETSILENLDDLLILSKFVLYQAQASENLQDTISKEDYELIMQLPIEEWLNNPSFSKAANKKNNAKALMKIIGQAPEMTPEIKEALANFEQATLKNFQN